MVSIVELLGNNDFPQKPILETLICHRTGLSKTDLFSKLDNQLSLEDIQRIVDGYHAYTIEKKPLEYILGRVEFSWLRFQVTPETIIPRPETEYMIEAIREFLEWKNGKMGKWKNETNNNSSFSHFNNFTLLDIWTGSWILWLSTLYHCGQYISQAYLTDLSSEALEVAKKNTQQLLSPINYPPSTVNFLACSLLDHPTIHELLSHSDKEVILVANLPYIPDELYASNAPESLTKWEPKMAFVGGKDGLDLYRQMFDQILLDKASNLTMFLEMMTRQGKILAEDYKEHFVFEEIKTFHGNIRILKCWLVKL